MSYWVFYFRSDRWFVVKPTKQLRALPRPRPRQHGPRFNSHLSKWRFLSPTTERIPNSTWRRRSDTMFWPRTLGWLSVWIQSVTWYCVSIIDNNSFCKNFGLSKFRLLKIRMAQAWSCARVRVTRQLLSITTTRPEKTLAIWMRLIPRSVSLVLPSLSNPETISYVSLLVSTPSTIPNILTCLKVVHTFWPPMDLSITVIDFYIQLVIIGKNLTFSFFIMWKEQIQYHPSRDSTVTPIRFPIVV